MNIAIIGNSHFGTILTRQLSEFDKINSYKFYNTNEKKIDKIKFALNIFKIDVVYSISATINGGGALNLALKFNKKIVQHFIGSDVLSAVDDFNVGNINHILIKKSTYLCEVGWIHKELKEIGLNSLITPMAIYSQNNILKQPKEFSVLTYMGKGKEEFYGMNSLIKIAQSLKDIEFKVAGIDSYISPLPKNIKLLGWIDLNKELQKSVCFIRNVKHDGLAFSVLEALGLGKVVFRNYKFPYCIYFEDVNDLIEKIKKYKELFNEGKLKIDYDAIKFVKNKYSKEKVLSSLVNILAV